MRSSVTPNKRIQDGPTRPWLCIECEQRFSRDETEFARRIFHPYLADHSARLPYGPWLLRFCVSLSWRVLQFHEDDVRDSYTAPLQEAMRTAEGVWREFLLGHRAHPGDFRQFLMPFDRIESMDGAMSPNINRYLMRAIQIDICHGGQTLFTYTKMGRFIVLGFINEPNPQSWRGGKVNANQGTVEPRDFYVPRALMKYINEKADSIAEVTRQISGRQHEKINANILGKIPEFVNSDFYQAMSADVEFFGKRAFHENQIPPKTEPDD